MTHIYFVRHAQPNYDNHDDFSRELSENIRVQVDSIEQANEGINKISEVIQSNSATAEESSATSEELSAQAANMDDLVARFQLRD